MKPPFILRDVLEFFNISKIEILDIGAMLEGDPRYIALLDQEMVNVTGFEPNPQELEKLNRHQNDNQKWLPDFLGNGEVATVYLTRYPGCSSLYEPDPEIIDRFLTIGTSNSRGNFGVIDRKTVQTKKLNEILTCPRADYIKIDVQGSELDILRNGLEKCSDALVIETEAEFIPVYKDQPLFGDIQIFMREIGFSFHKFINITGRSIMPFRTENIFSTISQALWADAIFVRDFPNFNSYSNEQLIKGAIILHDIYLSYDLANLMLAKLDARQNTVFAQIYQKKMGSANSPQLFYMNLNEETPTPTTGNN